MKTDEVHSATVQRSRSRWLVVHWMAWSVAAGASTLQLLGMIPNVQFDVALFDAFLILIAPVLWRFHSEGNGLKTGASVGEPETRRAAKEVRERGRVKRSQRTMDETTSSQNVSESSFLGRGSLSQAWSTAAILAAISWGMSLWTASQFGDLPPGVHDEYSYRFQARTFLAGRWSFPSHPTAAEIFDQVHVLNEGRFASRYFPGTGLWLAPFLAVGKIYWGQWLAGSLSVIFVFFTGRELRGWRAGMVAGLLLALSPGVTLFSNHLLAHHPTMLGLTSFLFFMTRFQRTRACGDALWSGCGLAFAMLCRPMTAAGFALPYGLGCLWWLLRGDQPKERRTLNSARSTTAVSSNFPNALPNPAENSQIGEPSVNPEAAPSFLARLARCAMLGLPLVAGLIFMAYYNHQITGDWRLSPYELYTSIYTPRHVYGFNNVIRGEQNLGPKVIDHYDKWADNLTPALALQNARTRFIMSLLWTLGIAPLGAALVVCLFAPRPTSETSLSSSSNAYHSPLWLVASILSLNLVHIPYWFVGIVGWHYVFETAPLWCLLFGFATVQLHDFWRSERRSLMIWWYGVAVGSVVLAGIAPFAPFAPTRLALGISEATYSRGKYAAFLQGVQETVSEKERPALVLVVHNPVDRHIDYVDNPPDLVADILIGRLKSNSADEIERLRKLFPDRQIYVVDIPGQSVKRYPRH